MADWYIQMEEGTTVYKYKMKGILKITPRQRKPVTSISYATAKPTDNILMAIQGMERIYDISFYIKDDTEDRSMGTAPTGDFPNGVKTRDEQENWLLNYIHSEKIGAKWKLFGDIFPATGLECVIEEIYFEIKEEDPLKDDCTIRITVGSVVA